VLQVEYNGKTYDYVFDVDIEDGKPPLKLPYNLSQNPYEAATKFIADNEIPMTYLDQVANFITSNTQGATIGQSQDTASAPGSDPWGSDQRYRPGGDVAPPQRDPIPKILPSKEYQSILVANFPGLEKKVRQLNEGLIKNDHKDVSLNSTQLAILASLCKHLAGSGATKTSQQVAGGLELVIKLSTEWPYGDRMPGLDLLRLLVVAPMTVAYSDPSGGNIVDTLIQGATETSPPAENHVMMAVRGFGNLFDTIEGRALAKSEFEKIQDLTSTSIKSSTNRNLLIAATTLYVNYAVLFNSDPASASFEHILAILDTLGRILESQTDSEVVFRALVATGTLLTHNGEIKSAAKDIYGIEKLVTAAQTKVKELRVKNLVAEIKALLK